MRQFLHRIFEIQRNRKQRRAARQSRAPRALRFETLEDRTPLAADVTAGVLNILGTNRNDNITVNLVGENFEVKVNREAAQFAAAGITSIHIDGLEGNDRITIGASVLLPTWIVGGKGNDTINGGGGDDNIDGGEGSDKIYGRGGDDDLAGDDGNDKLEGGDGDDLIHGGTGKDKSYGGVGNDDLFGDDGDDRVDGDDGDDLLHGNGGDDDLDGGSGNDDLFGDDGDDKGDGGDGDDDLDGGDGDDRCDGGKGTDRVLGGTGRDNIAGGSGRDHLEDDDGPGTKYEWDSEDEAEDFHNGGSNEIELEVQLGGAAYRAEAKFKSEVEDGGRVKESFTAAVRGAVAGDVLDVTVGGIKVGAITVGATGAGKLVLSSFPDGVNTLPFPVDFPQLSAGVTITIGTATGAIGAPGTPGQETELEVELRSGSFRANANFETEIEDGGVKQRFRAQVKVGTPGTTVDVVVDGVTVGQITVDAQGRGQLLFSNDGGTPFPAGFPEIKRGTSIKIGTAAGTFGTALPVA